MRPPADKLTRVLRNGDGTGRASERELSMSYVIVGRGVGRRAVRVLSKSVPAECTVIVDRRTRDRRRGSDRRAASADRLTDTLDRRVVLALDGRRVADRRALTIPAPPPELPWRL